MSSRLEGPAPSKPSTATTTETKKEMKKEANSELSPYFIMDVSAIVDDRALQRNYLWTVQAALDSEDATG